MKKHRLTIGLLVLVTMLLAVTPARWSVLAQGGLSEEELALLDRIVEARIQRDAYPAYADETNGLESLSFTMAQGELTNTRNEITNWTRSVTVMPGEPYDNVQGTMSATYTYMETESSGEQTFQQYVINAEVRFVEGVLYVSAVYDEAESVGELPELPEGWVQINSEEELDQYPGLDALPLDDLFSEESLDEVRETVELLKSSASEVFLSEDTLDDGTVVEQIIVNVNNEGMPVYTAENMGQSTLIDAVLAEGTNNSIGMMVSLEADNRPRGLDSLMHLEASGLAGSTISPDLPEDTTIDFLMDVGEFQVMTPLEDGIEPAVAPEELES